MAPFGVQSVSTDDPAEPGRCLWVFAAPVTVTGPVGGLRAFIDGAWRDPILAEQAGASGIITVYDTPQTLEGKNYRIVTTPTGIAQASGIVLPQNGTIESP